MPSLKPIAFGLPTVIAIWAAPDAAEGKCHIGASDASTGLTARCTAQPVHRSADQPGVRGLRVDRAIPMPAFGGLCTPGWEPTFDGLPTTSGQVWSLAVHDDGTGPALFAGGWFASAGGAAASNIAKWDGTAWAPLGLGFGYVVASIASFDDGSGDGPALYASGYSGPIEVNSNLVAKWDGSSWAAMGNGIGCGSIDDPQAVLTLAVYDDGNGGGPALHVGGRFTHASCVPANSIARWDGTSWSGLGSGMSQAELDWVQALVVHDDGSGPALYTGGVFTSAGGVAANSIARWNGTSWSPVGSGVDGSVFALVVHDDGTGGGPALYAGGWFTGAGGVAASNIAKWDGASWAPLGSGISGASVAWVSALAVYDDGSGGGPALYASGSFTTAGGVAAKNIAKWDGASWAALGSGTESDFTGSVNALAVSDGGAGFPALFAGGTFTASPAGDSYLARWQGCPIESRIEADLNNDGVVDGADLGILLNNWGGSGVGDINGDGVVDGADLGILLNSWTQ